MALEYAVKPVGIVRKEGGRPRIEVYPDYVQGLSGLEQFSHIVVLYWFHQNDTPGKRKTLAVHPRGDKNNPLTGVFATRSPARPNLIGITTCELISVDRATLHLDRIDALDGTPVIDIKPYMAGSGPVSPVRVPDWAQKQ
jgi:tRNA-Thr(GGU) m(6)t(6)A37 methyltransferase TsaA